MKPLFILLLLLAALGTPKLATAQERPPTPDEIASATERPGAVPEDPELAELRREVVDLRQRLDDVEGGDSWFNPTSATLTFLVTTGVVAGSYLAADAKHGEATRELMPGLTTGRVVGFGTLAAAGPALVAGIGAGFDNAAIVSAGITLDVLIALIPWGVGALANGITSSKYYAR